MKVHFDNYRISKKFRKFFQKRKSLRFNEDFLVCVFLVLVITYRFRFIHPHHISEIFSCTAEEAWKFCEKLVQRGYLEVRHLEESNMGFLIDGKGTYLFAIGEKGVTLLNGYGIENCTGKRSKIRVSSKLFHDMLALLITLKNADALKLSDFYPDFYIGVETQRSTKKPDIYILDINGRNIWIEIERSPKAGKELKNFFYDLLNSLYAKEADAVHIFLRTGKNLNYEKTWNNDGFILFQDIRGIENLRDTPGNIMNFYHVGAPNLFIHQSEDLYLYRNFQGEKPHDVTLKRQMDPVKK